ncbi:MAG TPA: hypothetical protein VF488_14395 [Gemmatimonadaceae bacterium]
MMPTTNAAAPAEGEQQMSAKREWDAPTLTRHPSLTVLTQHATMGTFSMLFQGISGGPGGFGPSPLRRHP